MNGITLFIIIFNSVCILYSIGVIVFGAVKNKKKKKQIKEKLEDEFKEKL